MVINGRDWRKDRWGPSIEPWGTPQRRQAEAQVWWQVILSEPLAKHGKLTFSQLVLCNFWFIHLCNQQSEDSTSKGNIWLLTAHLFDSKLHVSMQYKAFMHLLLFCYKVQKLYLKVLQHLNKIYFACANQFKDPTKHKSHSIQILVIPTQATIKPVR